MTATESLESFGRYHLLELLGRGGMGDVFRAHDTATDRVVAVKVLPAHLANNPEFQARFRREAQIAAALNDPHIVPIHNYGEIDGRLYVDMRLIEGRDLATIITQGGGGMDPERAVAIIEQVASALDTAHQAGLVHRDIKPSNVLVTTRDFAYLIDFGIARAVADTALTNTGQTIGTFAYMAPERFSGTVDPRADIYALTCVLHECLTGQRPYPGDSLEQQFIGHYNTPPPQPSRDAPHIPPGLDTVIARGMAKDPEQRFQSATELARAARDALNPGWTPSAPPPAADLAVQQTVHHQAVTVQANSPAAQAASIPTPVQPAPAGPHESEARRPARNRRKVTISILAVIAILVAVGAVVALRAPGAGLSAAPDAATLVRDAATTTKALTSAHVLMSVSGTVADLPVQAMSCDVTNQPSPAAQGDMTVTMVGSDVDTKFVTIDGTFYAAITGDTWNDFGPASDIYDATTILNPDTGLANLLANFRDARVDGRESVATERTVRIVGTVTADAANAFMPQLTATSPVPTTLWIRESANHQLVQLTLAPSTSNSVKIILFDWDKPVTVSKPAV